MSNLDVADHVHASKSDGVTPSPTIDEQSFCSDCPTQDPKLEDCIICKRKEPADNESNSSEISEEIQFWLNEQKKKLIGEFINKLMRFDSWLEGFMSEKSYKDHVKPRFNEIFREYMEGLDKK